MLRVIRLATAALAALVAVARACPAVAAAPYLVKDINAGTLDGSSPYLLTDVNGALYFGATEPEGGPELWKSDGTAAGTTRVADLVPGPAGSYPSWLTNVGGTLFFTALCDRNPPADCGLWKTDGTAVGTVRLTRGVEVRTLAAAADTLFFTVATDQEGAELWKSDGTAGGTYRIVELPDGSDGAQPTHLLDVNGTLYFAFREELWRSDGTADGTARVDIGTTLGDDLTAVNGLLFFTRVAGDGELWRTDGTPAGTTFLEYLGPAFGDDDGPPIQFHLGHVVQGGSGRLFFRTWFDRGELWTSDGTPEGTVQLATGASIPDDDPGAPDSRADAGVASAGDVVVFQACSDLEGCELWKTDGAPASTALLVDIYPGKGGSAPTGFTTVGKVAFFVAWTPDAGWTLWKTDGTAAGTVRVNDLALDVYERNDPYRPPVSEFTAVGGNLFFRACDTTAGCEPWRSDGTDAGTGRVADIAPNPPSASSSPDGLIRVGNAVFFEAGDFAAGRELWKSDGTEAGTSRIVDLEPGPGDTRILSSLAVGGLLYFVRYATYPSEVWRTDGTEAGTFRIAAAATTGYAYGLTDVDGTCYFVLSAPGASELWRSDGSIAGTVRVAVLPNVGGGSLMGVTRSGSTLFFRGCDDATGCELWRVDPVTGAASRVADLYPGPAGSAPFLLTDVAGTLFFGACEPTNGCEIWKSDGSAAGTTRVTDIAPGASPGYPVDLVAAGSTLLYSVWTPYEFALWRTDGTPDGTMRLAPGLYGGALSTPIGGNVFFTGCAASTGCEPWRTDGTLAGTRLVADLVPGPETSLPSGFTDVGGVMFFFTQNPATSDYRHFLLWTSDGTATGTTLVADAQQDYYYRPFSVAAVNGTLFFPRFDPAHGGELWAVSAHDYPPLASVPPVDPCGAPVDCDDGNPCTTDTCDPVHGCVHVPIGIVCDDGNPCTAIDVCLSGRCVGVNPGCDDYNPCTVDACTPAGCTHVGRVGACDDWNACTVDDHCEGTRCVGSPTDCDDGNPCTSDACDPARGCVHTPVSGPCDDGDACTSDDACRDGTCAGVARTPGCVDGVLCHGLHAAGDRGRLLHVPIGPFETAVLNARRATELCSMVASGETFVRYPIARTRGTPRTAMHRHVQLANRLGRVALEELRASSVLVRTAVAALGETAPVAEPRPVTYRCRRVRSVSNASVSNDAPILVADAFTAGPQRLVAHGPLALCEPTGGAGDASALACYAADLEDPSPARYDVVLINRFGIASARTTRVRELCLPSTIVP